MNEGSSQVRSMSEPFIQTKEFRRFDEFARSCTEYRYIGICHGEPGVGKSFAAMRFSHWNEGILSVNVANPAVPEIIELINVCRGVLLSAPVTNTPKIINQEVMKRVVSYGISYQQSQGETDIILMAQQCHKQCPLVMIDEADRLNIYSLEQIRHLYDELHFGLILIGMPGIEKRLSRFPQLYSRIGFSHEYKKLSEDEMRFILPGKWVELGLEYRPKVFSDVEAMNTIIRVTSGNFRLLERLLSQIKRILKINKLEELSKEVVDTARACLVIGSTT
jgi:DNA transposition AAA+ family ATPase